MEEILGQFVCLAFAIVIILLLRVPGLPQEQLETGRDAYLVLFKETHCLRKSPAAAQMWQMLAEQAAGGVQVLWHPGAVRALGGVS